MKYFTICIVLAVVFFSTTLPSNAQETINRISSSKEIRVGTTGSQAPFSIRSKSGGIIGYEIDLIQKLASQLGVRVKIVELPFAELLPSLDSKSIDIVMSGVTITPARNMKYAFAGPYLITGKSILTKNKKMIDVPIRELDNQRFKVATLKNSTSTEYVKNNLPKVENIEVDSYDSAVQMVINKEIDMLLADYSECAYSAFRNPDSGLYIKENLFDTGGIGMAIRGDDPLFLNLLQNFIKLMEDNGELAELEDDWFKDGGWLSEIE